MTYESCATFCSGYNYFGLAYSHECYCGNSIINGGSLVQETDCSMPCSGDAGAVCGGPNRLNVFKSSNPNPVASNPTIPGYTYAGCHTDSVGARVLTDNFLASTAMTVEMCATFCQGHSYFGTEYGVECYCGDAFANPTDLVPESDCLFTCGGNSAELCGAGNRLSLYAV